MSHNYTKNKSHMFFDKIREVTVPKNEDEKGAINLEGFTNFFKKGKEVTIIILHFEPVDNFILSTGVLLIYFILGLQISHNICFSLKMNTASPSPQSGPILNVFNWILSFQLVNTFQHF